MKEESQQDKDIANPPLPLTELAAKTEVGKIGMEFSKVESSLSTIIFSEEKSRLTNSKLGGIGYLPKDESYPTNAKNQPLVMLLQINFSQIADLAGHESLIQKLPSKGILQVYIDGREPHYGANSIWSSNAFPSESYQVRFWSDISNDMNMTALAERKDYLTGSAVNLTYQDKDHERLPFALGKEFAIDFYINTQSCHPNCREYELLDDKVKLPSYEDFISASKPNKETLAYWQMFERDLHLDYPDNITAYYFYEAMTNTGGSQLLGYPDFHQTDPRSASSFNHLEDFVLLFQLATDSENGIMWGDMGQAHFFIDPKDLANEDFSRLAYFWDCG